MALLWRRVPNANLGTPVRALSSVHHPGIILPKPLRLRTFGGLWLEDSAGAELRSARPRRLALLAILAVASPRGVSRERVLGILWPDVDEDRGRHALAQTLYSLRQELGDAVVGVTDLRLDPALVQADVAELTEALGRNDAEAAARLYKGAFLDGFYLGDAPEFERWVETERSRLARAAITSIEKVANADGGLEWRRRLTELDPLNGRYAQEYMQALVASGDRVAALTHARTHESAVRRELATDPDLEVMRLAEKLRRQAGDIPAAAPREGRAENGEAQHQPPVDQAVVDHRPRPRVRSRWLAPLGAVVTAVAVFLVWGRSARDAGSAARPMPLSDAGTTSPIALHIYEDGLRAFYQFDYSGTMRLMESALREDSNFAMAAYYAWRSHPANPTLEPALKERALRLASRAGDRERWLIVGQARWTVEDPDALAPAESLAIRYPGYAEGQILHGQVRRWSGDYREAASAFLRAVALDSASSADQTAACRNCATLANLLSAYIAWDSFPAAERTVNSLLALRPRAPEPYWTLADLRWRQGRWAEARAALDRAAALDTRKPWIRDMLYRAEIRRGAFDEVARDAASDIHDPDPARRGEARWAWLIALRNQGRMHAARSLLQDGILPPGGRLARGSLGPDATHSAILAFETGDYALAAQRYRQLAAEALKIRAKGHQSRGASWNLTLAGTAHAAAGDTAAVRHLADSVETIGSQSLYGRGRRLHHFLRGLVLAREGRHAEAADQYRRAVFSWTEGYTRINYELARSLLALGRPAEAIYPLQAALRGGIDGSNLYVTRTELHELLAHAHAAAGRADSAAAHFREVARAWQRADPQFKPRRQAAVQWLASNARQPLNLRTSRSPRPPA